MNTNADLTNLIKDLEIRSLSQSLPIENPLDRKDTKSNHTLTYIRPIYPTDELPPNKNGDLRHEFGRGYIIYIDGDWYDWPYCFTSYKEKFGEEVTLEGYKRNILYR